MKKQLSFLAALLLAVLLAGCGGEAGEDEFSYAEFNLESENGGFDENSDMAIFEGADPEEFSDDNEYVEDPAIENEVSAEEAKPDAEVYFLRILWGQLPYNPENKVWTTWDGKIYSNAAAIKVLKKIRFEDATDAVLPRTSVKSVEFTSKTAPHNDGLLLKIVVPKNMIALAIKGDAVVPTITFETAPYTRTLALTDLNGLHELVTADELGNKVLAVGFAKSKFDCPKGFIDGYWKRLGLKGGVFGGKFVSDNGKLHGKLAGIWGVNKKGQRVFFGIYKGIDNVFRGFIKGKYQPVDLPGTDKVEGGVFHGHFVGKSGLYMGSLKGFYTNKGGHGKFHGRYREACKCGGVKECLDNEAAAYKKLCGDLQPKECMAEAGEAFCEKCNDKCEKCQAEDDTMME